MMGQGQAKGRLRRLGRASEVSLWISIGLAPLLAGSVHPRALWVHAVLIGLSLLCLVVKRRAEDRRLSVSYLSLGLFALALFGLFQCLPLPLGLLEWISPRAAELRASISPAAAWASISFCSASSRT